MKALFAAAVLVTGSACSHLPPLDIPPGQGIRVVDPKSPAPAAAGRTAKRKLPAWERRKAILVRDLTTGESVNRAHAAFWLGELGPHASDAVPALVDGLRHENIWVRRASARALGKIGAPEAVKPLIGSLHDRNKWVRNSAIIALRKIGTPEARRAVKGMRANG
jgi:hypothetical protein